MFYTVKKFNMLHTHIFVINMLGRRSNIANGAMSTALKSCICSTRTFFAIYMLGRRAIANWALFTPLKNFICSCSYARCDVASSPQHIKRKKYACGGYEIFERWKHRSICNTVRLPNITAKRQTAKTSLYLRCPFVSPIYKAKKYSSIAYLIFERCKPSLNLRYCLSPQHINRKNMRL